MGVGDGGPRRVGIKEKEVMTAPTPRAGEFGREVKIRTTEEARERVLDILCKKLPEDLYDAISVKWKEEAA